MFWLGGSQSRLPDVGAGETQHSSLTAETGILEYQRAIPSSSNPHRRGKVYSLAPEAFFELPGMCGLLFCV